MKKRLFGVMMILAVAFMSMVGCNKSGTEQNQVSVLTIGTNATYVPFEFKNDQDKYDGFDMELAGVIAQRMGKQLEVRNISFDGLIPAVITGEIDAIFSGMVITPERLEKVDYIPYFKGGLGILIPESTNDIHGKADLAGKRIAVQMGTTGAVEAHTVPNAQIRELDHNSEALLELKKGSVDAVVCSMPVAQYYIATDKNSHAKLVAEPMQQQTLGIATKKGNEALKQEIEKALAEIKADGTYNQIYQKWFGTSAPAE